MREGGLTFLSKSELNWKPHFQIGLGQRQADAVPAVAGGVLQFSLSGERTPARPTTWDPLPVPKDGGVIAFVFLRATHGASFQQRKPNSMRDSI